MRNKYLDSLNNSNLRWEIKQVLDDYLYTQECDVFNYKDKIRPIDIKLTWYDNGYGNAGETMKGYAIDIKYDGTEEKIMSYLYDRLGVATEDFHTLQKLLRYINFQGYVIFWDDSDDQPEEDVDIYYGHHKNKNILVNAVLIDLLEDIRQGDYEAIDEVLRFIPKKHLKGFLRDTTKTQFNLNKN